MLESSGLVSNLLFDFSISKGELKLGRLLFFKLKFIDNLNVKCYQVEHEIKRARVGT